MKHNSIKKFPVVRRARAIEYLIMVFALNLVPHMHGDRWL